MDRADIFTNVALSRPGQLQQDKHCIYRATESPWLAEVSKSIKSNHHLTLAGPLLHCTLEHHI